MGTNARTAVVRLLLLLGALAIAACGDTDAARPSAPGGAEGGHAGAPIPISGSDPATVVGTRHFNRFHLRTVGAGFRPNPQEDVVHGLDPQAAVRVRQLDADARALRAKGKVRSAARGFVEAAKAAAGLHWGRKEEGCLRRALDCYAPLDEPVEMLETLRRLMPLQQARKDGLIAARTEADLGAVYAMLENFDRGLDHLGHAAAAFGRYGLRRSQAEAQAAMGLVYLRRAEYGPALDILARAQKLLAPTHAQDRKAYVLDVLGNVYESLGDMDRARSLYDGALKLQGRQESVDRADVLGNLGNLHFHLGHYDDALTWYQRAKGMFEHLHDLKGTGDALFNMGRVKKIQGGYRTALEYYAAARRLQEPDSAAAARTLGAVAETYLAMGRPDDALDELRTALDDVGSRTARTVRVELLVLEALAHMRKHRPDRAVEKIREALDVLMEVTAGLADEHVMGVREYRSWVFDAGISVALKTGRVDLATEFLEHSRAGALLEALGARAGLRGVPRDLLEGETLAEHRVAAASRAYQEARAARRLQALRAADEELNRARVAYRTVVQHIQRVAKHAANVFSPVPDTLADLRMQLQPGDVLVLYTLLSFQAHALVITPDGARVVWLGNTPDIRKACEDLRVDDEDPKRGSVQAVEARLAGLEHMVIDPLHLPAGTKRLYLSPDGPLCYVPFPLLVDDPTLSISCLPSGTTLRLLKEDGARTGKRVLALGDPVYRIQEQGRSLQVYADGVPLEPLPATRDEVNAITGPDDMRLLGNYATVRGLAEVAASRKRWSVIHLACHGLIDPRTPALSSLALTPDARDDGFLTALEVYGMSLPADMVVLSGCNTGRGRFVKGEGLVGLMRAFMCAGSPRVVVSLWKVNDEATKALMTRFHALWRTKRMSTSLALRKAQAYVRANPRWRHPRYWGAWVLWGLAD
jgi:CHAT domain-containing protein/lipopolysaccharide biosynthesis regulator YciM